MHPWPGKCLAIGSCIMPGLPTHIVQELNVGTVCDIHLKKQLFAVLPCTEPTDCALSLINAWVRIPVWACEKIASDSGLGGGFSRIPRFPTLLPTG